jgi:hypothetical protein
MVMIQGFAAEEVSKGGQVIDCTHPKTWEMSRVARKLQARIHGATFLDTSP